MATKEIAKKGAFAVIETGGKQYVVEEGSYISIEKLSDKEYKEGDKIVFDKVLLSDSGSATKVGTPTVSGSKVEGEVVDAGLGKKVTVIRYRSKSRHFKKYGHRQPFLRVKITKVA